MSDDLRERMARVIQDTGGVDWLVSSPGDFADALIEAGFGDVSAERERANRDWSETCEKIRVRMRRIRDERDALQARIDAATIEAQELIRQGHPMGVMLRVLAEDQPAATPEPGTPYSCADLGHETCDGTHPDHFTPEPPHLDPTPMHATYTEAEQGNNSHRYYVSRCGVCDWVGPNRREWMRADADAFAHRIKLYSRKREDYL